MKLGLLRWAHGVSHRASREAPLAVLLMAGLLLPFVLCPLSRHLAIPILEFVTPVHLSLDWELHEDRMRMDCPTLVPEPSLASQHHPGSPGRLAFLLGAPEAGDGAQVCALPLTF